MTEIAKTNDGAVFYNPSIAYLKSEDYDCVSMCLDENGVPRTDEHGNEYSLWGRILIFKSKMSNRDAEDAYWIFDEQRKKIGERLAFKNQFR